MHAEPCTQAPQHQKNKEKKNKENVKKARIKTGKSKEKKGTQKSKENKKSKERKDRAILVHSNPHLWRRRGPRIEKGAITKKIVSQQDLPEPPSSAFQEGNWAAANGGATNRGLRGVWPPFLEIGRDRPFPPVFCLFRPCPEGPKSTLEMQKMEEKGPFSSDIL